MANNNILLLSEDRLKSYTSLNENVWGKNILPAIKVSQDIELTKIIGSCLVDRLKELVAEGSISQEDFKPYKTLMDTYVTNFLAYVTIAHLVNEMSTKLTNFGTVLSNDEHLENVGISERDMVRKQYQYYADSYASQMASYLKANRELYPELDCGCGCDGAVKPNLDSTNSSQLWTGGFRGIRRKRDW